MSFTDDPEYGEKLRRVFKRNMQKDEPKTGIVQMLADWRKLRTEMIREENREFALKCLREEQEDQKKTPYISKLIGSDGAEEGAKIIAFIPRSSHPEGPSTA